LRLFSDIHYEFRRFVQHKTPLIHKLINCYHIVWEMVVNIISERGMNKGYFKTLDNIIFNEWFHLHQMIIRLRKVFH